jgi:hypothetical protein
MIKHSPGKRVLLILVTFLLTTCSGSSPLRSIANNEIAVPPPSLDSVRSRLNQLAASGSSDMNMEMHELMWYLFWIYNLPAMDTNRGVPDFGRSIGDTGNRTWETMKEPREVFMEDGSAPSPWETWGGTVPSVCNGLAANAPGSSRMLLQRMAKGDEEFIGRIEQAVGGTLVDQASNYVRYSIYFNETGFDYIVNNVLYNTQGQQAFTGGVNFPDGVMEIKASWRILAPSVDRSRYYVQTALVYTPPMNNNPEDCAEMAVGLVGLHISLKDSGFRQWIWSTFEQIDNVPPVTAVTTTQATVPWSFNDPTCPVSECPPNTNRNTLPTQVERVIDISDAAKQMNPMFQEALAGTVFQYYQLIGVQYPRDDNRPPDGNPNVANLSNVTMETYLDRSSCIRCHYTAALKDSARSSDFSFVFNEAHPLTTTAIRGRAR